VGRTQSRETGPVRVALGTWPTPVEPAPRLATALGLDPECLWIKRDDLTGLGGGGNKVRKLEFLCAGAIGRGVTTLVTSGAAQSNHARLTAAAAGRLGLECVLVLAGEPPAAPTGNIALGGILGAHVVWTGPVELHELDSHVEKVAQELARRGRVVEVIPYGGSSVRGAHGYLVGGKELRGQVPDLRHVVVAVGSGGTMAGLVAALGAHRVLGIDVGAVRDAARRVGEMVAGLAAEGAMPTRAGAPLRLRGDQIGPGYGILTDGARQALADAARCEGIILDPVYTAKALSGLAASVRDGGIGAHDPTVLLHTGGLPGLFGHEFAGETRNLPPHRVDGM
jgi:D-cysteine desulfhydrase